jgi:hypothetical protein
LIEALAATAASRAAARLAKPPALEYAARMPDVDTRASGMRLKAKLMAPSKSVHFTMSTETPYALKLDSAESTSETPSAI